MAEHGDQPSHVRSRHVNSSGAMLNAHAPHTGNSITPEPSLGPSAVLATRSSSDSVSGPSRGPASAYQSTNQPYLPSLPTARDSTSSLMAAVFKDGTPHHERGPVMVQPSSSADQSTTALSSHPLNAVIKKRKPQASVSRTPSTRSWSQSATDTESWDVLSNADSRLNEGIGEGEREEVVAELQKKVDRRKSQLPHLESQLAELEAQIKAAEARLAKAQIAQQDQQAPAIGR